MNNLQYKDMLNREKSNLEKILEYKGQIEIGIESAYSTMGGDFLDVSYVFPQLESLVFDDTAGGFQTVDVKLFDHWYGDFGYLDIKCNFGGSVQSNNIELRNYFTQSQDIDKYLPYMPEIMDTIKAHIKYRIFQINRKLKKLEEV